MAYTVNATQSNVFSSGGGTTGTLNTTGATLIIIGLTYDLAFGANISDSKSNTWTQLNVYSNLNEAVTIYYCVNPTVGSGHTFTTTSSFSGINVLAVNGNAASPFDQQSGNAANVSGTIQPGALTPTTANAMCVTVFGSFNPGGTPTPPTGYTLVGLYPTSTAEAGGFAYKISSVSENPAWTDTGPSQAVQLAIFLVSGGTVAVVNTWSFFNFF